MSQRKLPIAIADSVHYQIIRNKKQVVLVMDEVTAGIVYSGIELLNPEEKLNYTIAKDLTQDLGSLL